MKTRKGFFLIAALLLVIALIACDTGTTNGGKTDQSYNIGDTGPGGGKIIYYSETGFTVEAGTDYAAYTAHYLEAAPENMVSILKWSTSTELIAGVETLDGSSNYGDIGGGISQHSEAVLKASIGKGRKNTALIIQNHTEVGAPAANACKVASYGGKNDWFLPSIGELHEMYKQRTTLGISSGYFWSSSQLNSSTAWLQDFVTGLQTYYHKAFKYKVRAIRAF